MSSVPSAHTFLETGSLDHLIMLPCGHEIAWSSRTPYEGLAGAVLEHQSNCLLEPDPPIPFPEPRPIGEDPIGVG